jgi:Tfp pilus assembly protein PilV
MNDRIKKKKTGFGLIEILLVVSVGMATFLGVEQYLILSLRAASQDVHQTEALYWAKSNLEQARVIRDEDWALISGLTVGNQYSFLPNASTPQELTTQSGTKIEGIYTVWITTSQVQRDASDDIVTVGGVVDPNTLKINSTVSWLESGALKQVTISEYLVNFK